ncbi:excisionase family DNA binding protein [Kribbella orskensis]|uniref:Excisionase family DNA binding protein n=1 Tax=Kribbella orskensis TaxID=2512216 RepID=A0ABY2BEY1_9ACTN|nr:MULTISPECIES: helix-turn-helix domain-containing protein [Kribbella]TCN36863.1 excisionase family DNA binding protein [Kribbella sp. VKM Ac-2500]TCO18287.1 excisionase family DNA binding protein [Kribbella orskensis]
MSVKATKQEAQAAPSFYGVGAFAKAVGIGTASVYRAIHAGHLPALKFGGRYVVPARVLDQLVEAVMGGELVDLDEWRPAPGEEIAS